MRFLNQHGLINNSQNFHLIFTTSYDNYAIKAFQYNAINYLLKPIDPDLLLEAINRLPENVNTSNQQLQLDVLNKTYQNGDYQQLTITL